MSETATGAKVSLDQKLAFGFGMLANQMFPAALGIFMVVLTLPIFLKEQEDPLDRLRAAAQASAAAETSFPTGDPEDTGPHVRGTPGIELNADGYWHYEQVHNRVRETGFECDDCHKKTPMREVGTNAQMASRLSTCFACH